MKYDYSANFTKYDECTLEKIVEVVIEVMFE